MRQIASYLAMPIFLVDPEGTLLYYNEPAESLLGTRFDETGELALKEWGTLFAPTDREGTTLQPEELPLSIAVLDHRPAHREIRITGLDGVSRVLLVTAFPLVGQNERQLGAVAIFWQESDA